MFWYICIVNFIGFKILDLTTGNIEDENEKQKLIERILELQCTLEDLSSKVNEVKEENFKLKSENQILNGYMDNLMSASSSFHSTWKKQDK